MQKVTTEDGALAILLLPTFSRLLRDEAIAAGQPNWAVVASRLLAERLVPDPAKREEIVRQDLEDLGLELAS